MLTERKAHMTSFMNEAFAMSEIQLVQGHAAQMKVPQTLH